MNNVNAGCGKCKWFKEEYGMFMDHDGNTKSCHQECVYKENFTQFFDWKGGLQQKPIWEPQDKNAEGDCEYFEPIENGGLK